MAAALADLPDEASFLAATASLTPNTTSSTLNEAFDAGRQINGLIDRRLDSLCRTTSRDETASRDECEGNAATEGTWFQATYQVAQQDGNDVFTGYNADTISFTAGYDKTIGADTVIGGALTYTNIFVDAQQRGGEDHTELAHFTGYVSHREGPLFANGQASYVIGRVESDRVAAVGSSTFDIDSAFRLDGYNVRGTLGYEFDLGTGSYLAPIFGVAFGDYEAGEHQENGGLNLLIGEQDSTFVEGRFGAIAGAVTETSYGRLDFAGQVAYVRDFEGTANGAEDLTVFLEDQTFATLDVLNRSEDRVEIGAGANLNLNNAFSMRLAGNADFGGNFQSFGVSLRLKYNF